VLKCAPRIVRSHQPEFVVSCLFSCTAQIVVKPDLHVSDFGKGQGSLIGVAGREAYATADRVSATRVQESRRWLLDLYCHVSGYGVSSGSGYCDFVARGLFGRVHQAVSGGFCF